MATTFPFPASPTVGDQITLADGVTKLVWTGYSWEPISSQIAGLPSQGPVSGFRNRIINPSGAVTARASFNAVDLSYFCDRWIIGLAGACAGKVGAGSDATNSDFDASPYSAQQIYLNHTGAVIASPAAGDLSYLVQRIGPDQVADWKLGTAYAKPMVLSFVARTKTGAGNFVLGVSLRSGSGDRSFVQNVTINETPQRYSVLIPAPTSGAFSTAGGTAVYVSFAGTCGATFLSPSPGAWANGNYLAAAGVGNIGATQMYFRVKEVQLEVGTVPTAFEVRPYGTELHLCERYFQKLNFEWIGYTGAGTVVGATLVFRQAMRANPVCVATSGFTSNISASSTIASITPDHALIYRTGSAAGQAQFADSITADAEIS